MFFVCLFSFNFVKSEESLETFKPLVTQPWNFNIPEGEYGILHPSPQCTEWENSKLKGYALPWVPPQKTQSKDYEMFGAFSPSESEWCPELTMDWLSLKFTTINNMYMFIHIYFFFLIWKMPEQNLGPFSFSHEQNSTPSNFEHEKYYICMYVTPVVGQIFLILFLICKNTID